MANKKYLTEEEKKEARRLSVKKYNDKVKEKKKKHYQENKKLYNQKNKKYYEENKEEIKNKVKEYSNNNSEKILKNKKIYYEKNKEEIKEKQKIYRDKNRNKKREYDKNRKERAKEIRRNKRKNDNTYKLKCHIRNIIYRSFKNNDFDKSNKTFEIIGCTFEELKLHLESNFEEWMTWDNRGLYNGEFNYGWDIDHIIPLSTTKNEEDIIRLNHYKNLQPLCSHINRDIKKDRLDF